MFFDRFSKIKLCNIFRVCVCIFVECVFLCLVLSSDVCFDWFVRLFEVVVLLLWK